MKLQLDLLISLMLAVNVSLYAWCNEPVLFDFHSRMSLGSMKCEECHDASTRSPCVKK